MSDRFMTVAKVGEIPEGGVKVVRVDDDPVAVFHVGGAVLRARGPLHPRRRRAVGRRRSTATSSSARATARASTSAPARCWRCRRSGAVPRHAVRVIGDQIQVACETCDEKEAAQAAAREAGSRARRRGPAAATPTRPAGSRPCGARPSPLRQRSRRRPPPRARDGHARAEPAGVRRARGARDRDGPRDPALGRGPRADPRDRASSRGARSSACC